ncbi:PH domain-containing protein, putative, partial [Eimeria tenella]
SGEEDSAEAERDAGDSGSAEAAAAADGVAAAAAEKSATDAAAADTAAEAAAAPLPPPPGDDLLLDSLHARSRRCSAESVEAVEDFRFAASQPCLWDPQTIPLGPSASFVEVERKASLMDLICCGGREGRKGGAAAAAAAAAAGAAAAAPKEIVFRIKPVGSKRVFELKGPPQEVLLWVACLRDSYRSSKAKDEETAALVASQKCFWKIDRVNPRAFQDVCGTGDILLFRTLKFNARVQRLITRGTYDHVGMVLRNRRGEVYILECMGDTGVILTAWSSLVNNKWYRVYQRIVWRRLYWAVSEEKLFALLQFLKSVIGKDYKLTLAKLLTRKPYDATNAEGFFCSELIAGAWRVMGVIPEDAICAQYWPESFSQRLDSQLGLTEGCTLGEELLLDFCLYTPEQQQQQQQQKQQKGHKKKKPKPKQTPEQLPKMVSSLQAPRAAREKEAAAKLTNSSSSSSSSPAAAAAAAADTEDSSAARETGLVQTPQMERFKKLRRKNSSLKRQQQQQQKQEQEQQQQQDQQQQQQQQQQHEQPQQQQPDQTQQQQHDQEQQQQKHDREQQQ